MMKLFLFFWVLVLALQAQCSETGKVAGPGFIEGREELVQEQFFTETVQSEQMSPDWHSSYFAVLVSLTSAYQFDLPSDHFKIFSNLLYRTIRPDKSVIRIWYGKLEDSCRFLRMLAVRHRAGFYFYTLEKLII